MSNPNAVPAHQSRATADPAVLEFVSPVERVLELPAPFAARRVIWIVAALFASFVALAALLRVDQAVSASGKVVSADATQVVQPLEAGIVRAILVREGQHVEAGETLATLDPTFTEADSDQYAKTVTALMAETARLRSESEGTEFSYTGSDPAYLLQATLAAQRDAEKSFKLDQYRAKLESLAATQHRAESDTQGFEQRLGVASTIEKMRRDLVQLQVGSKLSSLAAQDSRLDIQRSLDDARAQVTAAARDIQALTAERDAYLKSWKAETLQRLSEQTAKLVAAQDGLRKAALRARLVDLRAQAAGRVLTVAHISVGSVLQPGQEFFTLVPDQSRLEVEANLAGRDSGFVRPGDPVAIKFDTFPFSIYGLADGRVRVLSPDSFTPQQGHDGTVPPPGGTELFYRARITITESHLHDTPEGFAVQAGMPVTADIKVGQRTLLSYLLGRLLPVAHEAFREP